MFAREDCCIPLAMANCLRQLGALPRTSRLAGGGLCGLAEPASRGEMFWRSTSFINEKVVLIEIE